MFLPPNGDLTLPSGNPDFLTSLPCNYQNDFISRWMQIFFRQTEQTCNAQVDEEPFISWTFTPPTNHPSYGRVLWTSSLEYNHINNNNSLLCLSAPIEMLIIVKRQSWRQHMVLPISHAASVVCRRVVSDEQLVSGYIYRHELNVYRHSENDEKMDYDLRWLRKLKVSLVSCLCLSLCLCCCVSPLLLFNSITSNVWDYCIKVIQLLITYWLLLR